MKRPVLSFDLMNDVSWSQFSVGVVSSGDMCVVVDVN